MMFEGSARISLKASETSDDNLGWNINVALFVLSEINYLMKYVTKKPLFVVINSVQVDCCDAAVARCLSFPFQSCHASFLDEVRIIMEGGRTVQCLLSWSDSRLPHWLANVAVLKVGMQKLHRQDRELDTCCWSFKSSQSDVTVEVSFSSRILESSLNVMLCLKWISWERPLSGCPLILRVHWCCRQLIYRLIS